MKAISASLKQTKKTMELKEKTCVPSDNLKGPLNKSESETLLEQLATDWQIIDSDKLKKEFPFENFKRAMAFAQEIALIAEKEMHHPLLVIEYDKVTVELSTHDVNGLSENDFIMAAKIEEL
ncbi:MAG: 4a-hydroxytetrahydrobiopterin dehydratase [Bacteroidales bacterium]|jgi:4a-hydroxytetrahydrobiopterin dehydratase|nr:4a-hydroxytetrahydrobiopterin dehydratase [Bacteroidales bacterium]